MLIETINEELKKIAQTEHFRHRYFNNFIAKVFRLSLNIVSLKKTTIYSLPRKLLKGGRQR
jgi:hypothetical protein